MATTQINNPIDPSVAANAAVHASENAAISAKAFSDSATVIAVVANDVQWVKKSLAGIETTLNDMSKAFVTSAQHAEVCKELEDHEKRLRNIEENQWKWIGGISVLVTVLTLGIGIALKIIR